MTSFIPDHSDDEARVGDMTRTRVTCSTKVFLSATRYGGIGSAINEDRTMGKRWPAEHSRTAATRAILRGLELSAHGFVQHHASMSIPIGTRDVKGDV
jgi:hypothetical protein